MAEGAGGCPGGAAPSSRIAEWNTMCPAGLVGDREAGEPAGRVLTRPSCPKPGGTQQALILTLALCAKHKYPLASDDLELVVLAAAGHLNGSERDHPLGEGILQRQSRGTEGQKLSHVC